MKAVIMTAPAMDASTTSVADIGEPRPGPGQVAIDVAYAGVNFIDVMARRGDPGYASAWPYVPGLEVAGTVRSVGSGVHHLRPRERVAAFTPGGGMAEVAIAAAAVTVEVPPGVPLGTAASAPLALPAPNGSSWAPACWTRCSTARWYWPGGSPPLTG